MDLDKVLFEKRYTVSLQQILAVVAVVLVIGSLYGFGHGYEVIDYGHYLAEQNGISSYRGFDGDVYHIVRDDYQYDTITADFDGRRYDVPHSHAYDLGRNYTTRSKKEYKHDRIDQLIDAMNAQADRNRGVI